MAKNAILHVANMSSLEAVKYPGKVDTEIGVGTDDQFYARIDLAIMISDLLLKSTTQ
jgi:hypothetical protein